MVVVFTKMKVKIALGNLGVGRLSFLVLLLSRWWQLNYFLIVTPKIGEDDSQFDEQIFSKGLVETNN